MEANMEVIGDACLPKANEGFFIGYSTNSKAFRVFNRRTRIVEENMHRKDTEVSQPSGPTEPMADETDNVESVPTHSNDPLLREFTLVNETQGRNDKEMFDTCILDVSTAEVTTNSATTTTVDELTLAQTLIEIKSAKTKAVTTVATTTTTVVTTPKARGVIVQEPNYELAARLQAKEQEELTIKEKSRLFVELMDKRKKNFARLRAKEQKRKPPTKAQKRNTIKEELESENLKKQKLDENVEAEVDDEAEMKKHTEIVSDDEVAIDAIPLATKP
ncbi:hypothetical protein Tco_0936712 [Tanacetum coccineum]|uniref:Retroviral polymerase SH3-like domain-containing protein n=1 Tax=Tanacetum coccineum TaxID=301880 RepID=A0ABQ5DDA2_9ASTR